MDMTTFEQDIEAVWACSHIGAGNRVDRLDPEHRNDMAQQIAPMALGGVWFPAACVVVDKDRNETRQRRRNP